MMVMVIAVVVVVVMIVVMMMLIIIMIMMVVTVVVRMVVRLVGHQLLRLLHSPPRHAAGQSSPALVTLDRVRTNGLGASEDEPARAGQRLERSVLQGVDAVRTDRVRRAQQNGFVHQVGG